MDWRKFKITNCDFIIRNNEVLIKPYFDEDDLYTIYRNDMWADVIEGKQRIFIGL